MEAMSNVNDPSLSLWGRSPATGASLAAAASASPVVPEQEAPARPAGDRLDVDADASAEVSTPAGSGKGSEGGSHAAHLEALRAYASSEPAQASAPSGSDEPSASSRPTDQAAPSSSDESAASERAPGHKASHRGDPGPKVPGSAISTGSIRITDPGRLLAGGNTAELQKFYLEHGNRYVPDCNGTCAFGKPKSDEELGLCEGTAVLAHVAGRTQLPESARPQLSDGEYRQAPINAAAALQASGDKGWNNVSYHGGEPHKVLDGVLDQVQRHGSGILGMGFTNPDGSAATGHALLVTEVREGKAQYTLPDGGTEERAARIFSFLDPTQRDGVPDDPSQQQAIVHFLGTNEVSWTPDVRELYRPDPGDKDQSVPQRGTWLHKGDIDYGTVSPVQLQNVLRRLEQGSDYVASPR